MLVNIVLDSRLNRFMSVRLGTPFLPGSVNRWPLRQQPGMILVGVSLTRLVTVHKQCSTSFDLVFNYLLFCVLF